MMQKIALAFGLLASGLPATAGDINIPVEAYKLKNGLRVILSRDNAVPVVTVYMIYRDVGITLRKRRAAPDSRICSNT